MNLKSALRFLSHWAIVVSIPVLLTVGAVRLVMSETFLVWEYNRPNFPADFYGFTKDERLQYAPASIRYLLENHERSYLEALRLPRERVPVEVCIIAPEDNNLCYMFNERERQHMYDVQVVTQNTYRLGLLTGIISLIAALYLIKIERSLLITALRNGSLLTLSTIFTIILLSLTAWDVFFTGFHQIFFEGDSWLFRYSDTLIRLFPEQFWFDAALTIGILVTLSAIVILAVAQFWSMRRITPSQEMV